VDIKETYRGFAVVEFNDFYGEQCSLQQSSIATTDCIWLGINDANPKVMAAHAERLGVETDKTTGWVEYPVSDDVSMTTRMHLSREQVKPLLPHLQKFVDTGEI